MFELFEVKFLRFVRTQNADVLRREPGGEQPLHSTSRVIDIAKNASLKRPFKCVLVFHSLMLWFEVNCSKGRPSLAARPVPFCHTSAGAPRTLVRLSA
jgi:hypothetical protein